MILEAFEKIAYGLAVGGVVMDHVTTEYLLTLGFVEMNPIARSLISQGIWTAVDVMLLVITLATPFLIIRKTTLKYRRLMLGMPIAMGLVRSAAAAWNIWQFLQMLWG